jgi:glucan phosphoethanolaminetransferase (alkaline phosphatase superfamily)
MCVSVLAVSTAYIVFFSWYFSFGRRFGVFHVVLVASILLTIYLATRVLLRLGLLRSDRRRRLLSATVGMSLAGLLLLYAADFVTNRLSIGNVNYELVRDYASWALGVHNDSITIPLWLDAGIVALLALVPAVFALLSPTIFSSMDAFAHPLDTVSVAERVRRQHARTIVFGSLVISGIILFGLSRFMIDAGLLHHDPIIGFFRSQGASGRFGWLADFEAQRQRVAKERRSYAAKAAGATPTRNVVMVIVDSLRADHMQIYGYPRETTPFLAELREGGHLRQVQMAVSTCSQSPCGILSTMSSKLIHGIGFDFKVFDVLHDLDYRLYFILGGRHGWEGLHQAYGDEQTLYFDGSSSHKATWDDDRMIEEGLDLVPPNARDKAFFYIHLMSAHLSGKKWPEYQRFRPAIVNMDLSGLLRGVHDREAVVNNYDNGVLQADAVIKEIFHKLRALDYLRNSVVVILADHGEALGEHGTTDFGHGDSISQPSIRIPLLIYDESDTTYLNLDFATQLDVAPTIAGRLGLPAPAGWRGHSLLEPLSDAPVAIGGPACGAALLWQPTALYKLVKCKPAPEQIFDIKADPGEAQDITNQIDAVTRTRLSHALTLASAP